MSMKAQYAPSTFVQYSGEVNFNSTLHRNYAIKIQINRNLGDEHENIKKSL